jgi:hypothetical protein
LKLQLLELSLVGFRFIQIAFFTHLES